MIDVENQEETLKLALNACVILNPKCFSMNCQDILEKKSSGPLTKLLRILMYTFFEKLAGELSESELFAWANQIIGNSFEQGFDDISDGVYFIKLVEAISGADSVNWAEVDTKNPDVNVHQCIEIARSNLIPTFLQHYDITDREHESLKLFMATCMWKSMHQSPIETEN